MKLEDFAKEIRSLSDEELQEELKRLRAARRMVPEKRAPKRTKKVVEEISPDII